MIKNKIQKFNAIIILEAQYLTMYILKNYISCLLTALSWMIAICSVKSSWLGNT